MGLQKAWSRKASPGSGIALLALVPSSLTSAQAVGIPGLTFHSQVAAGVCGLYPPAASHHFIPPLTPSG